MKSLVFVVAFALLAVAAPALSAEPPAAAPTTPLLQQIEGATAPTGLAVLFPLPRCSAVQGTSCSPKGSTKGCTDACSNRFTCICVSSPANPNALVWSCPQEC
jgi:hypothetical protein